MSDAAEPPSGDEREVVHRVVATHQELQKDQVWHFSLAPAHLFIVKGAAVLAMLGFIGWSFQNFLQLRGPVDLAASRIFLALMWAGAFVIAWIITLKVRNRMRYRAIIGLSLLLGVRS